MKISIIIPTYKRHQDLEKALDSLCLQKKLPNQTIIIDQSPDNKTKKVCEKEIYKKIHLQYFHYNKESSSKAKNFGIQKIDQTSQIIHFFDDDITLNSNYLQKVEYFLSIHPNALGGGGQITNLLTYRNPNHIGYKIFATPYIKEEFSTFDAQIYNAEKIQNITTTIGCNMFFKKEVFDQGYHFPQRMEKYSYGEDMFFSHAISTQYPKSLFYIPQAKIKHFQSPNGRIFKEEKIKQQLIHMFIFFKQNKLPIRKRYRRSLGFIGKCIIESENKKLCLKTFFQIQIFLHKDQKKIINNPKLVNQYIFKEKE